MKYTVPGSNPIVRTAFIPVFERWLYFGALRIPILCPMTRDSARERWFIISPFSMHAATLSPRHHHGISLNTCR